MIHVSIVIVSFNTKDVLLECLSSILKNVSEELKYEIIIVDNNSVDGTIEELKRGKLKLKIIENKTNLGFSKANNIGVRQARGKYILFLNSDTVVYQNTLEKMFDFIERHVDAGAATCKVVLTNGQLDDACHRGFPTPWNSFCHFSGLAKLFPHSKIFAGYSLGWMNLGTTHEIDACAGAFMLVRRRAGEEIGWWDEDYFWYGDDLDFCFSLKKKGWKIYYYSDVSIRHYKGVSGGIKKISQHITSADRETKKQAMRARFESMKIFYKKHYLNEYPPLVTFLVMLAIDIKLKLSFKTIS